MDVLSAVIKTLTQKSPSVIWTQAGGPHINYSNHISFCCFLLQTLVNICCLLPQTVIPELVVSVVALAVLIVVKELNQCYRQRLPLPIPIELIVVSPDRPCKSF